MPLEMAMQPAGSKWFELLVQQGQAWQQVLSRLSSQRASLLLSWQQALQRRQPS